MLTCHQPKAVEFAVIWHAEHQGFRQLVFTATMTIDKIGVKLQENIPVLKISAKSMCLTFASLFGIRKQTGWAVEGQSISVNPVEISNPTSRSSSSSKSLPPEISDRTAQTSWILSEVSNFYNKQETMYCSFYVSIPSSDSSWDFN